MLENINYPSDLKKLSIHELEVLAQDIRDFLIYNIEKTGGHLASNLGVVELTIALHYVFDMPDDNIIWDVSHQAYVHKILTGRKNKMQTIRKIGGLSGFAKIDESQYDSFGAGHSSTSISAALGMAVANKIYNNNNKSIAVIGDGALTGGMAFEAINNLTENNSDIIIIVNDNNMSISKNVGALSKNFAKILAGGFYGKTKGFFMKLFAKTPKIKRFFLKSEEHFKGMFLPTGFFESLGVEYFGLFDGHNLKDLINILTNLKNKTNPRVLHISTVKGKGHIKAEENPISFHGVTPNAKTKTDKVSYSKVFGQWLLDNAENEKIIAITPAMSEGSGMTEFANKYPNKFFDTGITEQHSITFAGGIATKGLKPIVAIYSTFLQRGYDQLIHDIAIQKLNVVFAIDRAGIVGNDGPTHNGVFDLSFLLPIPNLVIATPSNGEDLYKLLNTAIHSDNIFCIRYPRANTLLRIDNKIMPIGKSNTVKKGKSLVIFAFGDLLNQAKIAAEELNATLVNMLFAKPIDKEMVVNMAKEHEYIITIEDGVIIGGAGERILNIINDHNLNNKIKIMGVDDIFCEHGDIKTIYGNLGLDAKGIIDNYKELQKQ